MKKRIFTLFALGMLLSGVFSTVKAQTIKIDSVTITEAASGVVYEYKDPTTSTLFVQIVTAPAAPDTTFTLNFTYSGGAAYLGFPDKAKIELKDLKAGGDTIIKKFSAKQDWEMPNSLNSKTGTISALIDTVAASLKDTTFTFFNRPQFSVKYSSPTVNYDGELVLSVLGGDQAQMLKYIYYVDTTTAKSTYKKIGEDFSKAEIANLSLRDSIFVEYLGETYSIPIFINTDPDNPGGPGITRPVTIPNISDATINKEIGVNYVNSGTDFVFIIKPTGNNVGLVPNVKTGRTDFPDSEGVKYEQLADGSWQVTIIRVQSAINLTIDFTVGNASIDNNNVWASDNQLYVTSATSGKASVYTIAGALVKTITFAAGETTSTTLSAGVYVVVVNGESYKILVK